VLMQRTPLMVVALVALAGLLGCAGSLRAEEVRLDVSLNQGWKFLRQDAPGAEKPDFDDSRWEAVTLPHTWNAQDGQDGGRNYYRGIGWYRRHFTPLPSWESKSLFLRFDAAATTAEVFLNGTPVGTHKGNFGAFCFDVTDQLRPGQDNVLAVKVSNARDGDVPPLGGDFTIFGGLYRDVHLLVLDKVSVSPLDFASPGVYLKQVRVSPQRAEVAVTTCLRNGTDSAKTVNLRWTVSDQSDKEVFRSLAGVSIPAHGTAEPLQGIYLDRPHLWQGRKDPYLYTATVEVLEGSRVADRVSQPLGLRSYEVDPEKGFLLNGQPYVLHGVNKHQDRIDKGWAIGPAQQREDVDLMLEMGCTCVRLAHYQHPQYTYNLCDRSGLVVWAELALVGSIGKSPAFAANSRRQLTELIKQSFNHPSILFWSLYNELGFGREPIPAEGPKPWDLVVELNDLAHQLDSTRLTTAATNQSNSHPVNWITDIIAFNRYNGWYSGKPEDWPGVLDGMHSKYPTRRIGISEYGAGASILQHEIPPMHHATVGRWHPEEWQGVVHEAAYGAMKQRPWLWGTFLWNMFDFAVDARAEGDHLGRNDKGMVTYDRQTRKDTFYFYKANWTTEPFVYLTSRRYNPRPAGVTYLKVYSNCPAVELSLNGESLGSQSGTEGVFVWKDVNLPEGPCAVEVVGKSQGKTVTDAWTWTCRSDVPAPVAGQ
jgi:beta-galactosidase